MEEPCSVGSEGSSAMPHKRNPIVAERICGLARVVRANAVVGLENVALWHERDISHSSAERIVLPDSFLAVDYMLERFAWPGEGLVVRPERMKANVDASHGLFFSQRLLLGARRERAPEGRGVPARSAALDARVGRGPSTARARQGRRRARRPCRPRSACSPMPTRPMSTWCSTVCGPSSSRARRRSMPDALHLASGKVGPRASMRSGTTACCSWPPTGSRRSTSCFPPRSRTRAAC